MDEQYQIVVVGTDQDVEKKLPKNVIPIRRTQNQQELAKLYSDADVFVNPTKEEVLGMVNVEALACGTPVITFAAGGSPECIDKKSGVVVECGDVISMLNAIEAICEHKIQINAEDCIYRAKRFGEIDKYGEYIELYKKNSK